MSTRESAARAALSPRSGCSPRVRRRPCARQPDDEARAAAVQRRLELARCRRGSRPPRARSRGRARIEPLRSPCAAEEALEDLLAQLVRDARPVVLDREHHLAVAALDGRLDRRAGIGVPQRVLHQVQHQPVQLVAHAVDPRAGRRRDGDLVAAGDRLELGRPRR